MGICYIYGAMQTKYEITVQPEDLVIAADGGYRFLGSNKADLVVGDFDSLGFVPENENIVQHPVQKDDTDMMLAVKLGLGRGYRDFVILGGIGGRLDHTLANIQTLAYISSHGGRGKLIGEEETIYFLHNESMSFPGEAKGIVSVLAYDGNAEQVYLKGLEYELTDAVLTCDFPLGVSNAFTGRKSSICVGKGKLVVICRQSE